MFFTGLKYLKVWKGLLTSLWLLLLLLTLIIIIIIIIIIIRNWSGLLVLSSLLITVLRNIIRRDSIWDYLVFKKIQVRHSSLWFTFCWCLSFFNVDLKLKEKLNIKYSFRSSIYKCRILLGEECAFSSLDQPHYATMSWFFCAVLLVVR